MAEGGARGVTVVMRTRDRPLFLERALGSVLSQTFGDFEAIVVNDGGDAAAVERAVAKRDDPRVRMLHIAESSGMEAASNRALRESDSTYVAIHDDDDTWAPGFLEQMTGLLDETGAMGAIGTTDRVVERVEDGRIVRVEQQRLFPELRFVNLYRMCLENYATPICFLYRRAALETIGYYDEELLSAGDWEFALRFLSSYEIELLRTPDALAFYHHRPDADEGVVNAVHTDRHARFENLVANRLLRADLAAGRFGLGTIVNAVRYRREWDESLFARGQRASNTQVEYVADCVRKVDERLMALQEAVTPSERLKADLAFLRTLPGRVARRSGRS
jgi:glycosyltransferase involved in cell wall biosynthesis